MKKNTIATLAALSFILIGVVVFKLTASSTNKVRGVQDVPQSPPSLPENQDIRLNTPVVSTSAYLESVTKKVAEIAKLDVIEKRDNSTFHWTTKEDELEIVGHSLPLGDLPQQIESDIINFLENDGFIIDPFNISAGMPGHVTGLRNGQHICILRSTFSTFGDNVDTPNNMVNLELRCGELSPKDMSVYETTKTFEE